MRRRDEEPQRERNCTGVSQGVKVAHFYVCSFLSLPTVIWPCREITCALAHMNRERAAIAIFLPNSGDISFYIALDRHMNRV